MQISALRVNYFITIISDRLKSKERKAMERCLNISWVKGDTVRYPPSEEVWVIIEIDPFKQQINIKKKNTEKSEVMVDFMSVKTGKHLAVCDM